MSQEFSDLQLEKYILKELDEKQMAKITTVLETNSELQRRIRAINDNNQDFVDKTNRRQEAYLIKLKMTEHKYSWRTQLKSLFEQPKIKFLSSAVALCFVFIIAVPQFTGQPETEGLRTKGLDSHLVIYKKTQDQVEKLAHGTKVSSGDLIQLSYVSAGEQFGAIFSIDGNGLLTLHYPDNKESMTKLVTGKQVILPNAYELDSSPKFETFYLVTSNKPIKVSEIIKYFENKKSEKVLNSESHDFKIKDTVTLLKL